MALRGWRANVLWLGLNCAGACMFDTSPLGSPLKPVDADGAASTTIAGSGGTGAAGVDSIPIEASGGAGVAGTMAMPSIAGVGGSGSQGTTVPPTTDPPAMTAGASGSAAAGSGGSAAGSSGNAAGSGGAAAAPMPTSGSLPAITDPTMPGTFTVKRTNNVGPIGSYTTFEPMELGKDGLKHPLLVWGPSAGASPDIYLQLLNHVASHGFVVISYNAAAQGPELTRAIDWMLSEAQNTSSAYFDKIDATKIAMGGQSAGSVATFAAGTEARITTTLHINGGTYNAADATNLTKPAFIVCGDDPAKTGGDGTWRSDLARPNCDAVFMNATVPVWYGVVIGSSHTTVIDNPLDMTVSPLKVHYLASTVAWLRWQLGGDLTMKALFVGPDCGYCKQPTVWEVKQKDLM